MSLQKTAFYFFFLSVVSFNGITQTHKHIVVDSINSSFDEFNPMLSPDGNTLFITRKGHPSNVAGVIDQGDIWFANKTTNGWSRLQNLGKTINHQGLNGVVGFSQDGRRMYLLNFLDEKGVLKQGISVSELNNGQWLVPKKLPIKFFENKSGHISATISRDEKVLIISMTSFTTEGNEDLYVSFKNKSGDWSEPKNLGSKINTYAQEWTPFLANDNRTLYFSSNGRGGYGSRDIFVTKREEGTWHKWSEPVNMGTGINTQGVEMGFYVHKDAREAFFSTTQNSEGFGDIFLYPLVDAPAEAVVEEPIVETVEAPVELLQVDADSTNKEVLVLADTVKNIESQTGKIAISVVDGRTDEPVLGTVQIEQGDERTIIETSQLTNGVIERDFEVGTELNITVKAVGFLDLKKTIEVKAEDQNQLEKFMLTRKEVGTVTKIEDVLFVVGSSTFINPRVAHAQISKLVDLMKSNPGMRIRLEGHTDNRGDAKLLQYLSQDRVTAVRQYMISQGIVGDRIDAVGYGGAKPVASNDTTEGREANRRVEFVIVK